MHLHTRNVNTAFRALVELFNDVRHNGTIGGPADQPIIVKKPSRNGNVLMIDEPVMITYSHPKERVLFNQARDCNPFFHLYEAMWMLAGRNDVAPLAYYASKMKDFSDDGLTFNGAYGYRWRHARTTCDAYTEDTKAIHIWEFADQLDILVNHLKADPTSRRAVLQMWNVEDDLLKIGRKCYYCGETGSVADDITDEGGFTKTVNGLPCPKCNGESDRGSKDVCCNLSVMFSIREVWEDITEEQKQNIKDWGMAVPKRLPQKYLDMTVTNRSNDMIWGMLGADFVDFSFLQEYVAARLGVEVGRYNHFTNNLHVYDWNWKPEEWLGDTTQSDYQRDVIQYKHFDHIPLIKDPAQFEKELPQFVETYSGENPGRGTWTDWQEPFFSHVAVPMMDVFYCYKRRKDPKAVGVMDLALGLCENIRADDWRTACTNWITKRMK